MLAQVLPVQPMRSGWGCDTREALLQDYPSITADDIAAALEFEGRLSDCQVSDYEAVA